jgi:gentisate 1,2-dioxygenase
MATTVHLMSIIDPTEFAATTSLEELHEALARFGVDPGWAKREPSLWPAPRKGFKPAHWSYASGRAALEAAARFVSTEFAERRNLILFNPVEGNRYATSRTLISAYQMVLAGETARSHRHTPNALRLVMDAGPDTYTIVEGKRLPMIAGDVLLTPNWHWHGHANEGGQNALWIDFLDVPMMHFIDGGMFFERHPDGIEGTAPIEPHSPMRFARSDWMQALDAADEHRPGERCVTLGPPCLDTIGLQMFRLEPAGDSAATRGPAAVHARTTASIIYAVADGRGETLIGEERFAWARGDVFVVPAWWPHEHLALERSHLLRVSDEPFLERLHWLRTENQPVPTAAERLGPVSR